MTTPLKTHKRVKTTHVLIFNVCFSRNLKAPYVPSGKSILGAIECNKRLDLIRCHECGQWAKHLAHHVWRVEGMDVAQYKLKHGLTQSTALVSPKTHLRLIKSHENKKRPFQKISPSHKKAMLEGRRRSKKGWTGGGNSPELKNLQGKCAAQIKKRVLQLAKRLGRTPTIRELKFSGIGRDAIQNSGQNTYMEIMRSYGLNPRPRTPHKGYIRHSKNGTYKVNGWT